MGLFGDFSGNINPDFTIGKGISGNKKLIYGVGANTGELVWNPTGNKSVIIPDKNGTIATLTDVRNYGSFTVGGNTSTYYPVLFKPDKTWGGVYRLKIYRTDVHENFYGAGSFILEFQITLTNYGNIPSKIRIINYQRGNWDAGNAPINDPVGDIVDASYNNGNNEVVVFLKGGATYHWHNPESGIAWDMLNANASGASITDTQGNVYTPKATQAEYLSAIEKWSNVTLLNGWENFGNPYPDLSAYKTGDTVSIRGLVSHPSPSNGSLLGYLPTSCAPSKTLIFLIDNSNSHKMRMEIYNNGAIGFASYLSGSGGVPWVSINLTFVP